MGIRMAHYINAPCMISGRTWRFQMSEPRELKETGLKVTVPRLKVLDLFQHSRERHLTAEDVYRKLLEEHSRHRARHGLSRAHAVRAGRAARAPPLRGRQGGLRAERRRPPRPPRVPAVRPRRGVLRLRDREAPGKVAQGARLRRSTTTSSTSTPTASSRTAPTGPRARAMKDTPAPGPRGHLSLPRAGIEDGAAHLRGGARLPDDARGARHRLPGGAGRMGVHRAGEAAPRLAARADAGHAREPLARRGDAAGLHDRDPRAPRPRSRAASSSFARLRARRRGHDHRGHARAPRDRRGALRAEGRRQARAGSAPHEGAAAHSPRCCWASRFAAAGRRAARAPIDSRSSRSPRPSCPGKRAPPSRSSARAAPTRTPRTAPSSATARATCRSRSAATIASTR